MIELLVMMPWRAYLAALLALAGVGLVAAGCWAASRYLGVKQSAPEWAMTYLQVFRRVVVGLALIGAGAGWYWQMPAVVAASLCIGVGELLESSFYIEMMRWGQRRGVPWLVHANLAAAAGGQRGG